MEWVFVLAYHMLVAAGVALTAAGSAKLQQHEQPLDKAERMAKVGIAILAAAWGGLAGWTAFSFIVPRGGNPSLARAGTVVSTWPPHTSECYVNVLRTAAYGHRLLAHFNRHPSLLQCCGAVHAEGVA